MDAEERHEKATDLVLKAYEGGNKNLDAVTDELFAMSKEDRLDVIKRMTAIDKKCHEDPNLKKENLPTLEITDIETTAGSMVSVKTKTKTTHPAESEQPKEKTKH